MTDIENSYITATLDVTFSMSKGMSEEGLPIFIGFKQSLDALERYEILVNSNVLYQQTYVVLMFVEYIGNLHRMLLQELMLQLRFL